MVIATIAIIAIIVGTEVVLVQIKLDGIQIGLSLVQDHFKVICYPLSFNWRLESNQFLLVVIIVAVNNFLAVECDSFVAFLQPTLLDLEDTANSLPVDIVATTVITTITEEDWFVVAGHLDGEGIGISIVLPHAHHPQAAVTRPHHDCEVTETMTILNVSKRNRYITQCLLAWSRFEWR